MGLPAKLHKYFWDTDPSKLSKDACASFVIERILDIGDQYAVRWMMKTYSKRVIVSVLDTSRRISHKSWHFWKLIFSRSNTFPSCTPKSSAKRRQKAWKY